MTAITKGYGAFCEISSDPSIDLDDMRRRNKRLYEENLALRRLLAEMTRVFKPFTLKPVGTPHSNARLEQDDQITVYKMAMEALK